MPLIDFANPTRFLTFVERLLPWLMGAAALRQEKLASEPMNLRREPALVVSLHPLQGFSE